MPFYPELNYVTISSVMSKVWKIISSNKEPISSSEELVEILLQNRGVKTEKEKEEFLNPNLSDFEKDLDIPGIATAKKRILKAIENQELIIVYGDYDVDGVCGAAILYHGLTSLGAKVLPYIPHREKEGYGLSETGILDAKGKGAGLIVTIDHGIVALEQARFIKSVGIDLIITDHHIALDEKPEALSIIHSTKICGAAVGWCLVRQMVSESFAEELLDLVAIATICDLLPLTSVNRALVKTGLKKLNQTKRVGLLALIRESKLEIGELGTYEVGHILGPRINAIGRMEHAIDALRLLCTKDIEKSRTIARILTEANDNKKQLTADAISEAKQMIGKDKKILILHSENWIPGIIGLVAGRISDEYSLPAIVISKGELESKGSARSVDGLDIVEIIRRCSDLLIDVGGHPKAAGFTIETSKIEIFQKRLEEDIDVVNLIQDQELEIDALVNPTKVSKKMVTDLVKLEPTGIGNPKPLLASMNMKISGIKAVGNGQHLKFKADSIDVIAFSLGPLKDILKEGQFVNLAYFLEINRFNGFEGLQLKVIDLQSA